MEGYSTLVSFSSADGCTCTTLAIFKLRTAAYGYYPMISSLPASQCADRNTRPHCTGQSRRRSSFLSNSTTIYCYCNVARAKPTTVYAHGSNNMAAQSFVTRSGAGVSILSDDGPNEDDGCDEVVLEREDCYRGGVLDETGQVSLERTR